MLDGSQYLLCRRFAKYRDSTWRRMGAIMIGKTVVGIAIGEAAARHPLCNALSTTISIFQLRVS